jgi:hypothetical protein
MAEAGATGVTYYETTGWRGVMERAEGSPLPDVFRSIAGGVFPVYHVLADVGEFRDAKALHSRSSDPLAFDGLALARDGEVRVLLANLTADEQTVTVQGLPTGAKVQVRMLDASNAEEAMRAPEAYRAATETVHQTEDGALQLALPPYAVIRLDARS